MNRDNDSNLFFTPANKIKTKINFDLDVYNLPIGLTNLIFYHLYAFEQSDVVSYESPSDLYNIFNAELLFNPLSDLSVVVGVKNMLKQCKLLTDLKILKTI